jgi:Zn-finger nucleic acid-binding protein
MANDPTDPVAEPLLLCPNCRVEMRLFGVEAASRERDLYTFECPECGSLEVRGVLVTVLLR